MDFVEELEKDEDVEEDRIMFTCADVPDTYFD